MKKWTDKEVEFISTNYDKMGVVYCANHLNRTRKSVQQKAVKLNLKVNKKTIESLRKITVKNSWKNRKDTQNNLIKLLKIPIIEIKNSPTFLYVLGYLWGDGYIYNGGIGKTNSLSLEINREDGENIYNKMLSVINWNISCRKRKNRKEQICFTINNRILIEYLVSLDFHKKSYSYPKLLDILNFDMKRYFYLGLSDADGCFYFNKKHYTYQYSISSTSDQNWKHIIYIFDHLDIKYKIKKIEAVKSSGNINKHSVVLISNKKDVIKFGNYLYSDDFIGLNRKYEKYLQIINEQ